MLHGLTGNLAMWHLEIVAGVQNLYRITTYDLRGHGYSEMLPSGYTTRDMAADLEGLLDALEIECAHLVGHSFGADVALHFALLHPDRVNTVAALEPGIPALGHLRKREDWKGWRFWRDALAEFDLHVPREKWHDFRYLLLLSLKVPKMYGPAKGQPRKVGPLLQLLNNTTIVEDCQAVNGLTLDRITQITTPTLLVFGDNSCFFGTYWYLSEHLPNCKSVLLPNSQWGHFGPLEQPDMVVQQIRDFFDEKDDKPAHTPPFAGKEPL